MDEPITTDTGAAATSGETAPQVAPAMTGNLLDLDDMLSAPQTSGPAGLGGIDLGGVSAPNMQA